MNISTEKQSSEMSRGSNVEFIMDRVSHGEAGMTIKQILARLDGVFPMDDALLEGR